MNTISLPADWETILALNVAQSITAMDAAEEQRSFKSGKQPYIKDGTQRDTRCDKRRIYDHRYKGDDRRRAAKYNKQNREPEWSEASARHRMLAQPAYHAEVLTPEVDIAKPKNTCYNKA